MQTHPLIELIVVDDGSSDNSKEVIEELVRSNDQIQFLSLPQNLGNCKAFNRGLSISRGEFIIDLAADDVLLPDRVEKGVKALQAAGTMYGVNFSDAMWISENGDFLHFHSQRFPHHSIPEGDIYKNLISKFFICPPTMMFRRSVIDHLHGYDENLSYEDFDFWIRSSRYYLYCYTPEVLVKKRVVSGSKSEKQTKLFSRHMETTFHVCRKIMLLNKTREEQNALSVRLRYEITVCLRLLNFPLAWKYVTLLIENAKLKY